MAAVSDENPETTTPIAPKPSATPASVVSSNDSPQPPPPPTNSLSSAKDHILSVASKIASQPLQNSDPDVWAVLTAISANARKRHQVLTLLHSLPALIFCEFVFNLYLKIDFVP